MGFLFFLVSLLTDIWTYYFTFSIYVHTLGSRWQSEAKPLFRNVEGQLN